MPYTGVVCLVAGNIITPHLTSLMASLATRLTSLMATLAARRTLLELVTLHTTGEVGEDFGQVQCNMCVIKDLLRQQEFSVSLNCEIWSFFLLSLPLFYCNKFTLYRSSHWWSTGLLVWQFQVSSYVYCIIM